MQRFKKIQLLVLAVFALVLGIGFPVAASAAGNNVGYSVSAKIPKNQINKQNSFFDLKMKPGQTQTIQVKVYNVTNSDIKVRTAIRTAWTNSAGTVEYVTPGKSYDSSLKHKMSDITKIQGKKTLTIPAGSSRIVTAKITMPNDSSEGVILGGWYFKRVDSKVTGTVKGENTIKDEYTYVIGMKYTEGKVPNPNMKLGKVAAGMSDYNRGVIADLRNPTAVIIPKLKVTSTITDRDGGKVVNKNTKENVMMAPNTGYNYPMLYGKTALKAGNYHLHLVAKNSDHEWVFDRDFTITQAQANKYNNDSVESPGISIWLLIALGALGMLILILLILLIIYLIRRRRRDKEDEDSKK